MFSDKVSIGNNEVQSNISNYRTSLGLQNFLKQYDSVTSLNMYVCMHVRISSMQRIGLFPRIITVVILLARCPRRNSDEFAHNVILFLSQKNGQHSCCHISSSSVSVVIRSMPIIMNHDTAGRAKCVTYIHTYIRTIMLLRQKTYNNWFICMYWFKRKCYYV